MHDPTTTDALPTPEQMRNYLAAAKCARQARRLREASRAIITGNVAAAAWLFETILVIMHAGWLDNDGSRDDVRMLAFSGTIIGCVACMVLSLRWLKRQRSRSSVYVLDRGEAEAQRAPAHPVRAVMILISVCIFQGLGGVLWMIAFRHMSNAAIIAALTVGPLLAVGYFVYRFVIFLFWEDLLFAAGVTLAWTPFLFQAWHLAPLCLAAFPMLIVGTICLHFRWVQWQRSSALQNAGAASEEVRL